MTRRVLGKPSTSLGSLAGLRGRPGEVYARAEDILKSAGQDRISLAGSQRSCGECACGRGGGSRPVRVDLGLTRDIAYYTGMVFDVMADRSDGWRRWSL